jgi:hypothetical protein
MTSTATRSDNSTPESPLPAAGAMKLETTRRNLLGPWSGCERHLPRTRRLLASHRRGESHARSGSPAPILLFVRLLQLVMGHTQI